jgi:polysaccharide chain length determinant protein (PEP-CTERM system associated)
MVKEDQASNSAQSLQLRQYWQFARRNRRGIFLTFFFVWGAICGLSWLLPARYRSETTILIEQPKVPVQYVVPNVGSDLQYRLQTLTQQILSRTRLQHIIDDFHLYPGAHTRVSPDDVIEQMRKDINVELIQSTDRSKELTAFKILYSGPSGQLVQQVTSRLASLFIEENLHARQQQSEQTTDFLQNQLQDARARLEQQEARLKQFKAQHVGQLPSELQANIQILGGLDARLQGANEGMNRAEQQRVYLTSLLNQYHDTPGLAGTGSSSGPNPLDIDTELARLRAQLVEMQSRYTDSHPAVLQLREQIAKNEKVKQEMTKDTSDSANHDQDPPKSRGVAEIESQLKATELDIQNRHKRISELELQSKNYQMRLSTTPLREQQLADLSRDYDQTRANYQSLLAKMNQSALATDLEKTQQGEQFAVLDPPSLPNSPYSPNRVAFSLGGALLGLALGGAGAILREKLDDRIHAETEIPGLSKLSILVTIPALVTPGDVRRGRWRTWGEVVCATAMLSVVAASTLAAYYRG